MTNSESLATRRPRIWPLVVAGLLLVAAAVWIGRHFDVARYAPLDFTGRMAEGTIEYDTRSEGAPAYVIRYEHPDGSIYRMRYTGDFPMGVPADGASITVRYDAEDPSTFQPSGISYVPTTATVALCMGGILCVLTARKRILRHSRRLHGHVE